MPRATRTATYDEEDKEEVKHKTTAEFNTNLLHIPYGEGFFLRILDIIYKMFGGKASQN